MLHCGSGLFCDGRSKKMFARIYWKLFMLRNVVIICSLTVLCVLQRVVNFSGMVVTIVLA